MTEAWYRRRWFRWGLAGAIVLVIGGLFVQRELLGGESEDEFGLLDGNAVAVGDPVPDFRLRRLDGGQARLSDFRGKTVVLNFWASWCPPCRAEMPEFQALWDERGADATDDLVILAVDVLREDSEGAAIGFVEEFDLTFPALFDTADGDVAGRYGVRGLPATFFIDGEGVLRASNLGPVFGDLLHDGVAKADAGGA